MVHCFKMNGKQEFPGYKYTGNSKNDFEQHVLFHESNHFEDDHFECSLCDYVTSNERAIQEHSLSCKSIKSPITNGNIKQDRLSKEDSLEYTNEHKHIEVKIEDHPFEIDLKQENYTKEISTTDMIQQIELKQDSCPNDKGFNYKLEGVHTRINTGEHLIFVDTENKQCADFVQHNPAHSLNPTYQCNICKRYFYSKISTRRHKGNGSEKLRQCSLCEKKFCYQVDLERHNKTHTQLNSAHSLKPTYQCNICKRNFYSKISLRRHKGNGSEKLLQCSLCEKKFCNHVDVERHNQSHTKYISVHSLKQTYQCNICKKYLISKISMRRHKGNASEKPRQCSYCEKKFCYQVDLESHSKSHTKYNCFKCNKTFSTLSVHFQNRDRIFFD